jgi:hypothetical protein
VDGELQGLRARLALVEDEKKEAEVRPALVRLADQLSRRS